MGLASSGKGLLSEFQAFAFKGNMVDLAVGVVIGAAFGKVISSIVDHVIMPVVAIILNLIPGLKGSRYEQWDWHGIKPGLVFGDLLNFMIVAAAVFIFVVKFVGFIQKLAARKKAEEAPPAPTTKECPKCLSVIPIMAVKCAHCTSDLVSA